MRALNSLAAMLTVVSVATLPVAPVHAGSFEIAPTTIELASGSDRAVFYITNHGAEPVAVQIQGFDWRQTPGGEQLGSSDVLTSSPPMARLMPDRRQTIRLAIKPAATTGERSFRLIVSELPDPQASTSRGIRMLLQVSVPVFVASAHPGAAHLVWNAERGPAGITLTALNTGLRHAKLMDLFLTAPDGSKIAIAPRTIAYVLAGASRTWQVALPGLKMRAAWHVTGRDDGDGSTIDAPVNVVP